MPKKPVNLRIDEGLWERVKAYAKEEGSTATAVVEEALHNLTYRPPWPLSREDIERMEDEVGGRYAGCSDIGEPVFVPAGPHPRPAISPAKMRFFKD